MEIHPTGVLMHSNRRIPFFVFTISLAVLACDLTGLLRAPPSPEAVISTPFWTEPTVPSLAAETGYWAQGPASLGQPLTVGNVEVRVNDIRWPADTVVLRADSHPIPGSDEQFALVDVSATCRADPGGTCTVTVLSFSLSSNSGKTYPPIFETSFQGLPGLFEGGQIPAGDTRSGDLVFLLERDAAGLTLIYNSVPGGVGLYGSFQLGP